MSNALTIIKVRRRRCCNDLSSSSLVERMYEMERRRFHPFRYEPINSMIANLWWWKCSLLPFNIWQKKDLIFFLVFVGIWFYVSSHRPKRIANWNKSLIARYRMYETNNYIGNRNRSLLLVSTNDDDDDDD